MDWSTNIMLASTLMWAGSAPMMLRQHGATTSTHGCHPTVPTRIRGAHHHVIIPPAQCPAFVPQSVTVNPIPSNSSRRPPPSHLAGSPGAYWASQCRAIPTVCICWGCDVPGCPLAGALYSFNSKSASRCSPTPPPPLDPHTRTLWVPLGYSGHPNAGQY